MINTIFGDTKKGLATIPLFVVGIFIIVLAVGGWTYRRTIQFSWDPEGRTDAAVDNLVEAKALHYRARLGLDIPKTSPVSLPIPVPPVYGGKINIELEGDMDKLDAANPKWQGTLKIGFTSDGVSLALGAEVKNVGDLLVFKLTEFPSLGPMGAGFDEYKGRWWKVDLAELRELQSKQQAMIEEELKRMPPDERRKAEELIREFTAAAEGALKVKFLTGFEKVGREKVNGVSTFHVKRFVNKEGLVDAYFEVLKLVPGWYAKIMFTANMTGQMRSSEPPDFDVLKRELKKAMPDFADIPVHFWIGVRDGNVYQIQPDLQKAVEDQKVNITLNFAKHDQPVEVVAPADAQEFDLAPYLSGFGL